ncbi:hypothetical protein, partial [Akkermansia sp.]|uniref:hypothetical protein n=1 Tax=Akkermansia sp. TaxID=1872421 RepID=UPI003AB246E5
AGVCVESRFRVAVPRLQIKFKGPELRYGLILPGWDVSSKLRTIQHDENTIVNNCRGHDVFLPFL